MNSFGIKENTELFWKEFIQGNIKAVDNFLSPDCRLQDQFGLGIGSNDHAKVLTKLQEIQQKIVGAKLDTTMKNIQIMRSKSQIRFMINGSYGFVKIVLGFAIEWQQGIITTLIIIKGASETTFYVDDTEAPTVVCNLSETASPNSETINVPISPPSSDALEPVATIEPVRVVSTNSANNGNDKSEKWYPGKLLNRMKSGDKPTFAASLSVPESMLPYESLYPMTKSLCPPFIVPKPPTILPTIRITVIKCTNLVSRLKTVIPRPINCYVEVTVHNRTRNTPVVARNANPVFDSTNGNNQFVFDIPNTQSCNVQTGCVVIQVKDKHAVVAEDILAEVSIPLVSLKCCHDNSTGTNAELCFPLQLFEKHRIGKGFVSSKELSTEFPDKEKISCLYLSISKVDIYQWWLLEELRARDEQKEQELLRIKAEKARELKLREEMQALKVAAKEAEVIVCPDIDANQKLHWVNDDIVKSCPICDVHFGLLTRKHHCRKCGGVFCDACSSFKITTGKDQEVIRVCKACYNAISSKSHASNSSNNASSDVVVEAIDPDRESKTIRHSESIEPAESVSNRLASEESVDESRQSSSSEDPACIVS